MAGRHRAAALAVLVRALFENISLEDSAQRVSRLRHIDFQAFVRDRRAADWLYATRRSANPFGCCRCACEWQVMPRCACSSRVRLMQRLACRERSSSAASSRRWRWAA